MENSTSAPSIEDDIIDDPSQQCDESKCLSTGLMPPDGGNPFLFNCYAHGPGTLYPFMCADNYTGVEVANNEFATADDPSLKYFTCCPTVDEPAQELTPQPERHCENPQEIDLDRPNSWNVSSMCAEDTPLFPYGRETTQVPGIPDGYMCCNVDLESKDDFMLGAPTDDDNITMAGGPLLGSYKEPECYSFMFCGNCVVNNNFGDLEAMHCYNDVYQYPQIIMNTGNSATYQCCRTPQGNSTENGGYYTSSKAFQATVWTQFTLALIASIMSLVIINAICVSLYQKKIRPAAAGHRARRTSAPDYSTYNLYLVLLAIPDLAYNVFILGIVNDSYNNGWIPENDAFITCCATINMYMNVVIAYEVMVLLRRTKNCQRYIPPSYKKAGIQFGIVSAYGIVLAVLWYYLLSYFTSSDVRATVAIPLRQYTIPLYYVLVFVIPAIALIWICFAIWKEKLLPKGQVGRKKCVTKGIPTTSTAPPSSQGTVSRSSRKLWWSRGPSSRNIASSNNKSIKGNSITSNANGDSTKANANATAATIPIATAPTYNQPTGGRLNILAMYFLRIILVFFFIWFPGMVMYYQSYLPGKNQSSLLHNIGLMFFSLQAMVSSGMAMTKSDVRKSIQNIIDNNLFAIKQLLQYCGRRLHSKPDDNIDGEDADRDTAYNGKHDLGVVNEVHAVVSPTMDEVDIEAPPAPPEYSKDKDETTATTTTATSITELERNVHNDYSPIDGADAQPGADGIPASSTQVITKKSKKKKKTQKKTKKIDGVEEKDDEPRTKKKKTQKKTKKIDGVEEKVDEPRTKKKKKKKKKSKDKENKKEKSPQVNKEKNGASSAGRGTSSSTEPHISVQDPRPNSFY